MALTLRVDAQSPDVAVVREAAELMSEYQVRRLPVVENDRLVGIVSLGDIAISSNPAFSGMALRDVSEPRQPTARQRRLAQRSQTRMPRVPGATATRKASASAPPKR